MPSDYQNSLLCTFSRTDLTLQSCTAALAREVGRASPDELLGAYVIDLFSPHSLHEFEAYLLAEDFSSSIECRLAGGSQLGGMLVKLAHAEDGDAFELSFLPAQDHSAEIARLRNEIERLRGQSGRLERLSALLTHDLRGSLHAVLSGVEVTLHSVGDTLPPVASKQLQHVKRAADSMHGVLEDVSQLLQVKYGNYPLTLTEFDELVDDVILQLSPVTPADATLRRAGPLPSLMCREPLVRELVRNLIENSIKYRAERPLQVDVEAEGPTLVIRDNGVGIAPEDLERVLSPLARADRAGLNEGGTGMGLALAVEIAENHGGSIRLTSDLGVGTTVYVTLQSVYEIREDD